MSQPSHLGWPFFWDWASLDNFKIVSKMFKCKLIDLLCGRCASHLRDIGACVKTDREPSRKLQLIFAPGIWSAGSSKWYLCSPSFLFSSMGTGWLPWISKYTSIYLSIQRITSISGLLWTSTRPLFTSESIYEDNGGHCCLPLTPRDHNLSIHRWFTAGFLDERASSSTLRHHNLSPGVPRNLDTLQKVLLFSNTKGK